MTPPRIEKLQCRHKPDDFDCGQEALNRFLIRNAHQNRQSEASHALADEKVVG
jgi:hypothetical protein